MHNSNTPIHSSTPLDPVSILIDPTYIYLFHILPNHPQEPSRTTKNLTCLFSFHPSYHTNTISTLYTFQIILTLHLDQFSFPFSKHIPLSSPTQDITKNFSSLFSSQEISFLPVSFSIIPFSRPIHLLCNNTKPLYQESHLLSLRPKADLLFSLIFSPCYLKSLPKISIILQQSLHYILPRHHYLHPHIFFSIQSLSFLCHLYLSPTYISCRPFLQACTPSNQNSSSVSLLLPINFSFNLFIPSQLTTYIVIKAHLSIHITSTFPFLLSYVYNHYTTGQLKILLLTQTFRCTFIHIPPTLTNFFTTRAQLNSHYKVFFLQPYPSLIFKHLLLHRICSPPISRPTLPYSYYILSSVHTDRIHKVLFLSETDFSSAVNIFFLETPPSAPSPVFRSTFTEIPPHFLLIIPPTYQVTEDSQYTYNGPGQCNLPQHDQVHQKSVFALCDHFVFLRSSRRPLHCHTLPSPDPRGFPLSETSITAIPHSILTQHHIFPPLDSTNTTHIHDIPYVPPSRLRQTDIHSFKLSNFYFEPVFFFDADSFPSQLRSFPPVRFLLLHPSLPYILQHNLPFRIILSYLPFQLLNFLFLSFFSQPYASLRTFSSTSVQYVSNNIRKSRDLLLASFSNKKYFKVLQNDSELFKNERAEFCTHLYWISFTFSLRPLRFTRARNNGAYIVRPTVNPVVGPACRNSVTIALTNKKCVHTHKISFFLPALPLQNKSFTSSPPLQISFQPTSPSLLPTKFWENSYSLSYLGAVRCSF